MYTRTFFLDIFGKHIYFSVSIFIFSYLWFGMYQFPNYNRHVYKLYYDHCTVVSVFIYEGPTWKVATKILKFVNISIVFL